MVVEDFGTYLDGSSVYKDKRGYHIYQWDNVKQVEYKKYLNNWKPPKSDTRLILDNKTKKWKIVKKHKKQTKTKRNKNSCLQTLSKNILSKNIITNCLQSSKLA